jgi:chromatin structure-remodeling complex subunit RSC4
MHKPSKKLYADYYLQIQRPVSLDDVKKKLDASGYPTFEAVRQDLELCFTNAKTYNQKNSQIWKDAKHLHVSFKRACQDSLFDNVFCRNWWQRNPHG